MLGTMSENHAAELQVFVEAGCDLCRRALHLAEEVDGADPGLAVRVIDVSEAAERRDDVFAVPTFVLNGRVFSLGNPEQSFLREAIESLLRGAGSGVD